MSKDWTNSSTSPADPASDDHQRPARSKRRAVWRVLRDVSLLVGFIALLWAGTSVSRWVSGGDEEEEERTRFAAMLEEATRASDAGEQELAIELYRELVFRYTENGWLWLRYGAELHAAGRYEEAIRAYDTAATFPRQEGVASYMKARSFARQGQSDEALRCLHLAYRHSYSPRHSVARDEEFASLSASSRFQELAQNFDRRSGFIGSLP